MANNFITIYSSMLFRNNAVFTVLMTSLLLTACNDKNRDQQVLTSTPAYESEDFQSFYEKFGTDTAYQMAHIVFPLEGMPALRDSTDVIPVDFRWERDQWVTHKPYDDMNGTFAREFIDFKGIVIEKISDASGRYTMERRFSKMSDGWQLIYYRAMGVSEF